MCVYWIRSSVPGVVTWWARRSAVMLRPVLPPPHLDINILSRVHQLINSCDIWCVLTSAQCRLTQCAPLHCIVYCICIFVAALSGVSDTFISTVNRILYTVVTFPFPILRSGNFNLASPVIFCLIFWFCQIETNACVSSCRYEVDIHACYFYDKFEWLLSAVLKYLTNEISNCNERLIFTFMASAAGLQWRWCEEARWQSHQSSQSSGCAVIKG